MYNGLLEYEGATFTSKQLTSLKNQNVYIGDQVQGFWHKGAKYPTKIMFEFENSFGKCAICS